MRALLLLLFTLLAGSAAAQDSVSLTGCKDDQVDCRDECTVEYGGSTRTYDKLGACLQKCKQKYDKCRERQFAVQEREKLNLQPESSPSAPPPTTEKPSGQSDATGDSSSDAPKGEAAESTGRRGVFRASESAPEPEPEATAKPEHAKAPEPKKSKPVTKASESKASESKASESKASESKKPESEVIADTTELDQLFDYPQPPPPPKRKAKSESESPRPKPAPEPQKKDAADQEPIEK